MNENPYDPRTLSRRHYRECLWLRDTLESVARELERMAARGQGETGILLGLCPASPGNHLCDVESERATRRGGRTPLEHCVDTKQTTGVRRRTR